MSDCCTTDTTDTKELVSEKSDSKFCPSCKVKGNKVKIITLKSMLKPSVLDSLNSDLVHFFALQRIVVLFTLIQIKRLSQHQ